MYVTPGGGTVYTTDLKSVGASLTSSNLVWGIRERLDRLSESLSCRRRNLRMCDKLALDN